VSAPRVAAVKQTGVRYGPPGARTLRYDASTVEPQEPAPPPGQPPAAPVYWMPPEPARGPAPGVLYVGLARRLVAYLIDWLILGFAAGLILVFTVLAAAAPLADQLAAIGTTPFVDLTPAQQAAERTLASATLIGLGLAWLATALYFIVMWHSGATIGMRAVDIRVAREEDGRPIGFGRAAARYLGYLVDWLALGLGLLWVAVDERHQGWHDKIAGTLVVRPA